MQNIIRNFILLIFFILFSLSIAYAYIKHEKEILLTDIKGYDRFFWNKYYSKNNIKNSYKFIIVGPDQTSNGRVVSDETLILRIVRAASKVGWQARYYSDLMDKEAEIAEFNPDFIISTIPKWNMASNIPLPYKIYSFIPLQRSSFFKERTKTFGYNTAYPQIFTVSDGLIITDESFLLFKELFEMVSKNPFNGIVGYPGVDYFDYDNAVTPRKIIYYGINWDPLRASKRYLDLYTILAKEKVADFFGPFIGWINNYRDGWKGFLTLRRNINNKGELTSQEDQVLSKIKEYGIVLILHSNNHFGDNLPSLREFEAAASSSVIITDELSFVKEHFGDSALYINTRGRSAENIADQILKHYKWIIENPDKVKEMTKKAHDIYRNKFTLEKMLLDIAHMHESVLKNEKIDDAVARKGLKGRSHLKRAEVVIPAGTASY